MEYVDGYSLDILTKPANLIPERRVAALVQKIALAVDIGSSERDGSPRLEAGGKHHAPQEARSREQSDRAEGDGLRLGKEPGSSRRTTDAQWDDCRHAMLHVEGAVVGKGGSNRSGGGFVLAWV